jgi:hypothetical protein
MEPLFETADLYRVNPPFDDGSDEQKWAQVTRGAIISI